MCQAGYMMCQTWAKMCQTGAKMYQVGAKVCQIMLDNTQKNNQILFAEKKT